MTNLDQVVKDGIRIIEKKVDERLKLGRKNEDKFWRGKKIITVEEWNIQSRKKNFQYSLINYFPAGYVEIPLGWLPEDTVLRNKASAWYKDYNDYLEMKKDSEFGEYKCRRCILHPDSHIYSESLRKIIIKGVEEENGPAKFPCQVVNMFECPYGQSIGSDDLLLFLGEMWKLLNHSLGYARSLDRHREYTFDVDFEKDRVEEYGDKRLSGPNSWGTVEDRLGGIRFSKIRVDNVQDVYNVLTNKKTLEVVIEQYLDDKYDNTKVNDEETAEELQFLREAKEYAVDYFAQLQDKIKIEDVRNMHEQTIEEEKQAEKEHEEILQDIADMDERCDPNATRSGQCLECKGFSNIHCINCDIWICENHWRDHKSDVH